MVFLYAFPYHKVALNDCAVFFPALALEYFRKLQPHRVKIFSMLLSFGEVDSQISL